MGGMQVLEWALLYPERVETIAPIAVGPTQSAWGIALSEAQRQAIRADGKFDGGRYPIGDGPSRGLAAARAMAMASYRSPHNFEARFGRSRRDGGEFQMQSYLRHQGEKLVARFDANTYLTLVDAMDSHDIGRERGSIPETLGSIRQPALVIGVSSDGLYPAAEVTEMASHLPNAELTVLDAPHGHDAFLIEVEAVNHLLVEFLNRHLAERELRPAVNE
jgi:homoserine O-acetyltransferase